MKSLFLIGVLLIDLFISSVVASSFSFSYIIFVPMTSLLFLSYRMMQNPSSMVLSYGFIAGLLVDLMMHSVLFTHAIIYVIALIVLREYQRHFSDTMLEIIIMGLLVIFIKELLLLMVMNAMNITDMSILIWYRSRLFFTLIGNIPLILIAYYLSNKLDDALARQEKTKKRSETTLWGFLKD